MFNYLPLSQERRDSLFEYHKKNELGTDYIVGDIHGCFTYLERALEKIGFNKWLDRLYCVGDLVDRGEESKEVLYYIQQPWLHTTLGNHEYFAILYLQNELSKDKYKEFGGKWLIKSKDKVKEQVLEAFNKLPIAIELETDQHVFGIVHGDIQSQSWIELKNQIKATVTDSDLEDLVTSLCMRRDRIRQNNNKPIQDIDYVVHGHTYVQGPRMLGNVFYIDTGIVFGGYISLLNTKSLEVHSFNIDQLDPL